MQIITEMSLSLSSQVVQFLVNSRMVYPPSSTPLTRNQSWLESMGGSASCTAKRSCGGGKAMKSLVTQNKSEAATDRSSVPSRIDVWLEWQVQRGFGPERKKELALPASCWYMLSGGLSCVHGSVSYSGAISFCLQLFIEGLCFYIYFDNFFHSTINDSVCVKTHTFTPLTPCSWIISHKLTWKYARPLRTHPITTSEFNIPPLGETPKPTHPVVLTFTAKAIVRSAMLKFQWSTYVSPPLS